MSENPSDNLPSESVLPSSAFKERFKLKERLFPVEMSDGTTVTFRLPAGSKDYLQAGKAASAFVEMCQSPRCPAEWRPHIPEDEQAIAQCYWIYKFCDSVAIEGVPVEPLHQKDWLEMAHDGLIVSYLYRQFETAIGQSVANTEASELEALKNA